MMRTLRVARATAVGAAVMVLGSGCSTVFNQVIVVRHADKAISGATTRCADPAGPAQPDPPLSSPAGTDRAQALADAARDAGVRAVYATCFQRSQQTAQPLAAALGLPVTTYTTAAVVAELVKTQHPRDNVLIVAHSTTVSDVVEALGGAAVPTIAEDQFDNAYVVTRYPGTTNARPIVARVLRLHYGAPTP